MPTKTYEPRERCEAMANVGQGRLEQQCTFAAAEQIDGRPVCRVHANRLKREIKFVQRGKTA